MALIEFTDIDDFILDQIYGYQDANNVKENTTSLRDAWLKEHNFEAGDSGLANHGTHQAGFLTSAMVGSAVINTNNLKTSDQSFILSGIITGSGFNNPYYLTDSEILSGDDGKRFELLTTGVTINATNYGWYYAVSGHSTTAQDLAVILMGAGASNVNTSITVVSRYMTASPPHTLGIIELGKILFVLRDKITKALIKASVMDDPTWFGHQKHIYDKDDQFLPMLRPHPYPKYFPYTDKMPEDDGLEIVLVDLRQFKESADVMIEEDKVSIHLANKEMMLQNGLTELQWQQDMDRKIANSVEKASVISNNSSELNRLYSVKLSFAKMINDNIYRTPAEDKRIEHASKVLASKIAKLEDLSGKKTLWDKTDQSVKDEKIGLAQMIITGEYPELTMADDSLSDEEESALPQGNFKKVVRVVKPADITAEITEEEGTNEETP